MYVQHLQEVPSLAESLALCTATSNTCFFTVQCHARSNKWYTRARLLLRRGYHAYQANELNADKITTFSDHLNYEAVVQAPNGSSVFCMKHTQSLRC